MALRKSYLLLVKTNSGDYLGTFHSPFPEKRLSEAVSKLENYLNLKDVTQVQTGEKFPFIIINKNVVEMIILAEEREGEDTPSLAPG